MSLARARLWQLPRLLAILWADTRQAPLARRRDEDAWALGKLIVRGKVHVWREAGRVRAFIARDGVRIHALYTEPQWRGRGAGARLVREAMDAIERLELWTAQANAGARRFYAGQGFREIRLTGGEGNDEGVPDVLMKWERPSR